MKDSQPIEMNMRHWDDIASGINIDDIVKQIRGHGSTLGAAEITDIGDINGLLGLHLQCGLGKDTVSLSAMGANMVGVDVSSISCAKAREIANALHVKATFIQGDVLAEKLTEPAAFDFVYTSHGVLRWLPSLDAWARNIYRALKPGGWFYIFEIHPLVYHLNNVSHCSATLTGNYFDQTPKPKTLDHTHLGTTHGLDHVKISHSNWTLEAIISVIIQSGLRITKYAEYPFTSYSRKGLLASDVHGMFGGDQQLPIPLAYSIKAERPISST